MSQRNQSLKISLHWVLLEMMVGSWVFIPIPKINKIAFLIPDILAITLQGWYGDPMVLRLLCYPQCGPWWFPPHPHSRQQERKSEGVATIENSLKNTSRKMNTFLQHMYHWPAVSFWPYLTERQVRNGNIFFFFWVVMPLVKKMRVFFSFFLFWETNE